MPTVPSTDGVELVVHDLGGDGPPLLLAHATGFHGMVWAPMAERLARSFHAWAIDFRGHGDSSRPSGGFDWHGFADDVLAVVDDFGLERPFGVGHSKGGAALLLAEQRRPGTFRAMFLYEPVVFPEVPWGGTTENPLSESARRRRDSFASYDDAYGNFSSKPPFSALHPDALRAYVDHGFAAQPDGSVRLKCRREDEAEVYAMAAHHHAFGSLPQVSCPVVVGRGDDDWSPPAGVAADVAANLPAGRLETFDGLGHFGPLEDPDALAAAVERAFRAG